MRQGKIKKAVKKILQILADTKPTRLEILVILGQVLINTGYTIYYQKETVVDPPGKVSNREIQDLYLREPTLGTALMKLGFDLQGKILEEAKEAIEKGKR